MNVTKNVPELRFKEFSGEWEEKRLGELFSFLSTNSFSRDNLNYEIGEVKNIHYGDIHTKFRSLFDITKEYAPFINKEILNGKITEINFCKEGDIVIADASEDYEGIGKAIELVNLNNEKVVAGLHTLMARPINNKLIIGFTGHMLKSNNVRYQIKMIAQGTKVLSISSKRMKEIPLNIPALSEQQKIASFLTAVDKKIEIVAKKIKHLENYKKGLMQKLLTGEIRFPGFNDEWKEERLGNICKIKKGEQLNKISLNNFDKYPVINGGIRPSGYLNKYNKNENTIVISEGGACGYTNFIKTKFWSGGHCYTLEELKNIIVVEFLYQYLKFNEKHVSRLRVGSGLLNIQQKAISNFEILFPSLPEQQKIASFLSAIDKKIELVSKKLENLKTYKKGLLQKMFL
ncbi:MAG: restriction endonuclease subunit S [Candidatus Acididesulfobacter diazotrophicus]|jgi:type I restriction enzyme S subunit|uniref:Restriction endonuclease subunit S n=1 Tax=Candidatus Acididesulfobacter diazotrophicus TaxID=2597226 RepID=A0A519BP76_9DELT|nr:MAG: restriction endonuclease subunit S [Candidatus Acididesulfobacter diazotrophicus]